MFAPGISLDWFALKRLVSHAQGSPTVRQTHCIYSTYLGLHPYDLSGKDNKHEHKTHAADLTVSNNVLCLWSRSLLPSSSSLHETGKSTY